MVAYIPDQAVALICNISTHKVERLARGENAMK